MRRRNARMIILPVAVLLAAFVVGKLLGGKVPVEGIFYDLMDTEVKILIYADGREEASEHGAALHERMAELEKMFNACDGNSVVSKINESAGGEAVKVPVEFIRCLDRAVEISRRTGGAMDVTVRPLILLWKNAAKTGRPPTEAEIAEAKRLVDYRKIEIDRMNFTVRLPEAGMSMDLGAVAKGFIVDEGVELLRERGVESALIEAGGDIAVIGAKPDGAFWRIGLRNPSEKSIEAILGTIYISDRSVTTSGHYERFITIDGKKYSHIIDPRTGRPVRTSYQVSIVAPDCTTADALATAASVLGAIKGIELAEALPGVEALFVEVGADGVVRETATNGFPPRVK